MTPDPDRWLCNVGEPTAFAKLKHLLRKARERDRGGRWNRIGLRGQSCFARVGARLASQRKPMLGDLSRDRT